MFSWFFGANGSKNRSGLNATDKSKYPHLIRPNRIYSNALHIFMNNNQIAFKFDIFRCFPTEMRLFVSTAH